MTDDSFSMRTVTKMIGATFGDVDQVDTTTLQEWLSDEAVREKLLLLDAREPNEFEVSHLANARRTDPAGEDYSALFDEVEKNDISKVVVYCSVGYRSARIAQKIQRTMAKKDCKQCKVYNLDGSIFKWANEGRTMVDMNNAATEFAHPYNALWGRILESKLRKSTPGSSL